NIGTTFLEEWVLDRAEEMYRRALEVEPENVFGLLGCIAVACQREDLIATKDATQQLITRCPDWRTQELIKFTLVHDRSFRFLRDTPEIFEHMLGLTLETFMPEKKEVSSRDTMASVIQELARVRQEVRQFRDRFEVTIGPDTLREFSIQQEQQQTALLERLE